MSEPGKSAVRPSVLSLNISSKSALYAAYMPFITHGGLFVPTNRKYELGDEVFLLLQFMDDPTKHPVAAKVVWLTPNGAQGGKTEGVGRDHTRRPDWLESAHTHPLIVFGTCS